MITVKEPVIQQIKVLDAQGRTKPVEGTGSLVTTGRVQLKAGTGVTLEKDDAHIRVSIDTTSNVSDPVYQQKWIDIIKGNYPYSGLPYYVTSINNIKTREDMPYFILGHLCSQMGIFETPPHGTVNWNPSPDIATMELFDMCEACVDCADYDKLFQFVYQIERWADMNKDNNLVSGTRLFKQYQSTVHYWNYLVHCQSLVLRFYGSGRDIMVKAGYRAMGCDILTDVRIGLKLYATNVPRDILIKDWNLLGITSDPPSLDVAVYEMDPLGNESSSSSDNDHHDGEVPTGSDIAISINQIQKGQSTVVTLSCILTQTEHINYTNNYVLEATWFSSHLGSEVKRTKKLTLSEPYYG